MDKKLFVDAIRGKIADGIKLRKEWVKMAKQSLDIMNFLELLPDFPENPRIKNVDKSYGEAYEIEIEFRYDRILKQKIMEQMENAGFVLFEKEEESQIQTSYRDPNWMFSKVVSEEPKKTFYVKIFFDDAKRDATCKRVKIGEKSAIIPIYEWICPEGAEESKLGE